MSATNSSKSPLVSCIIACILSLVIFASLRFYANWFNATQLNILMGGFTGSWLFLFNLTAISNIECLIFGIEFQAKFIPEILFCLTLAVIATGFVHRVCATTCVLFSLLGLYFINRISTKYHSKGSTVIVDTATMRKSGKKHK